MYHACVLVIDVVIITGLSDGMNCFVPYTSGIIYQCELGGAVYNIIDIDTVPTPDTTTTTQRTTTTTVRTHSTSHKTTNTAHKSTTSEQSMITT